MPSSLKPRKLILACLGGIVGFLAVDAALFRLNVYPSVLAPDSTTGDFERGLRTERLAQRSAGDNLILLMGDSRMAFPARYPNQFTPETGYVFRNGSVSGTAAREWYYLLRDLDPKCNRYQAIVFPVDSYDDEDNFGDHANEPQTIHYVVNRLRWYDVFDLPWTFHDPTLRWQAFRGTLFKGFVYQRDIYDFLDHPKTRIDYVRLVHRDYDTWIADWEPPTLTLAGLSIDWSTHTAVLPPSLDENQRYTVDFAVKYPPTAKDRLDEYRRLWFGRIFDRYRGSRTRMVFLKIPRDPLPRPAHPPRYSTIRDELAKRPGVLLFEEHATDGLERPELFRDGRHLNRDGYHALAEILARGMAKLLGRPVGNPSAL